MIRARRARSERTGDRYARGRGAAPLSANTMIRMVLLRTNMISHTDRSRTSSFARASCTGNMKKPARPSATPCMLEFDLNTDIDQPSRRAAAPVRRVRACGGKGGREKSVPVRHRRPASSALGKDQRPLYGFAQHARLELLAALDGAANVVGVVAQAPGPRGLIVSQTVGMRRLSIDPIQRRTGHTSLQHRSRGQPRREDS